MTKGKILLIDDDPYVILSLQSLLERHFSKVLCERDPSKIPSQIHSFKPEVVLLDMNYRKGETSGSEGLSWINQILEIQKNISIIPITAYGGVQMAVDAMKLGAVDFILKPWQDEKLISTIKAALNFSKSKEKIRKLSNQKKALSSSLEKPFSQIITRSEKMKSILKQIQKIAPTDANVLITGENGTGKELIARAIHKASERNDEVFMNVDLGSIHSNLIESELYGHVKGAFTDAREARSGRFEVADQGTLFLDEIANLPVSAQSKLLTSIQQKRITPVGSNESIEVDIRLICATNEKLKNLIENSEFREDLFYRINTIEIHLPALRERAEDIEILVEHFIQQYCKKYRKNRKSISKSALHKLQQYNWPGNIRELQHSVERAVILQDSNTINATDFQFTSQNETTSNSEFENLNLENLESWAVKTCLQKHNGNVSKAAIELGLTRGALYRRMEKYGI